MQSLFACPCGASSLGRIFPQTMFAAILEGRGSLVVDELCSRFDLPSGH